MPLDPQAQVIVDALGSVELPPLSRETLALQREGFAQLLLLAGEPEAVASIADVDAGGVPARVYRPSDDPVLPIVVYFHGGGWTIGTVEQFDPILRQVANASGAVVVAPDYRLAPEHPFPAAIDDCRTALQWVAAHAADVGGDAARLAVMGDSAGGNLAAVCAIEARDAGSPDVALQVLVYPVTDCDFEVGSYRENGDGYLLTAEQMRWFFECYTSGGADPTDPRISPMRTADLAGVAPAIVVTAEYDPLRDEGERYAQRLRDAGVPVEQLRYDGMIHAFFGLSGAFDASRDALRRTGDALRRALATSAA